MTTTENPNPLDFFPSDLQQKWHQVRGWLLPNAARQFFDTSAAASPEGRIVEIGSYAGKSACCIGWAQRDRGNQQRPPVVAIDIQFQKDFHSNLATFGLDNHIVTAIEGPSLEVAEHWHEPISFLYIDGHHGDAHAVADFVVWEPFVLPGSVIALDDTAGHMSGPIRQVQIALSTGAFERICEVDGVTFLRKNRSLFPELGRFPPGTETEKADMAVVAAVTGALDPEMCTGIPGGSPQEQKNRIAFWLNNLTQTISNYADSPTKKYLSALVHIHQRNWQVAADMLTELHDAADDSRLQCHDVAIRPLAMLRLGQVYDLLGKRAEAISCYQKVCADEAAIPEALAAAENYQRTVYALPEPRGDLLLRQFVTERQLPQYRNY